MSTQEPNASDAGSDVSLESAHRPRRSESADPSSQPGIVPPAMDPTLTTIQPGGGIVMSIELAWGKFRRSLLRTLRRGYVQRMRSRRMGEVGSVPLDPIDSRDLKYYQNQETCRWDPADDPHSWRSHLGFVRAGLAELVLIGGGFLVLALVAGFLWWPLALPFLVLAGLVGWFFRNPQRDIPAELGTAVSPADGKLVQIERFEDPELGICIRFGIFLSIFNVHANRAALPGEVVKVAHHPGKFLNALRPESARENESLDLYLRSGELDGRIYRMRQITGQFARRIVCWERPGRGLRRGEMYGMIKLGSRTELIIPDDPELKIVAEVGRRVSAGSTVLAKYG